MRNSRSGGVTSGGTPAVADAMAILDALRRAAPQSTSVSEVSRLAGVSKASCHRILQTLASGEFVVQDPDRKDYTLGPALVALGAALTGDERQLALVRDALAELAHRSGMNGCSWRLLPNGSITLIAQAPTTRHLQFVYPPGTTYAMDRFQGLVFLAWSAPSEFEHRVQLASWHGEQLPMSPGFARDLGAARQAGWVWSASARTANGVFLGELAAWLRRARRAGIDHRPRADVDAYVRAMQSQPPTGYASSIELPVVGVAAPVFDHTGSVSISLSVIALASELPPEEVAGVGEIVRTAAAKVTHDLGGRVPAFGEG